MDAYSFQRSLRHSIEETGHDWSSPRSPRSVTPPWRRSRLALDNADNTARGSASGSAEVEEEAAAADDDDGDDDPYVAGEPMLPPRKRKRDAAALAADDEQGPKVAFPSSPDESDESPSPGLVPVPPSGADKKYAEIAEDTQMALVKVELSNPKGMAVIVPLIRYNEKHEDQLFEGHVPQTYLDTVLQCLDAELESKIEILKQVKLDDRHVLAGDIKKPLSEIGNITWARAKVKNTTSWRWAAHPTSSGPRRLQRLLSRCSWQ